MSKSIIEKLKPYQEVINKRNQILSFFSGLEFNAETHSYKYKGVGLTSVSKKIKNFVTPFETKKIAGFVAKSREITVEEVLKEWEEKKNFACNKGNRVHDFGENYTCESKPSDGLEEAVKLFWETLPEHIVPVIFELKMFSYEYSLAGTADIILYNLKTKKFIIADYKTNIDLFKNYRNKTLLGPFKDLLDMPYSKYQLQLSFYQILFEQCGFEIERRTILWLKPDGSFNAYDTEDFTERIKTIL